MVDRRRRRIMSCAVGAASGVTPPNLVTFDGSTTYLTRGADLTGAADGKVFTASFWFKYVGGTGATYLWSNGSGTGNRFSCSTNSANGKLTFTARNSAGTSILFATTGFTGFVAGSDVHHVYITVDLADTNKRAMYIDGALDSSNWTTYSDDSIDFTTGDFHIGALVTGGKLNGCVGALWINNSYLGFDTATIEKFIDASGVAVDLGATGQLPTGAAPLICLNAAGHATWHTNVGTGGGFTETGALTDC